MINFNGEKGFANCRCGRKSTSDAQLRALYSNHSEKPYGDRQSDIENAPEHGSHRHIK